MAVPVYRPFINAHGLKALMKKVDIPDYHLMVGSAECLESQNVTIYRDVTTSQGKALLQNYENMDYETATQALNGSSLTIDDFPGNTMYLGDATGA